MLDHSARVSGIWYTPTSGGVDNICMVAENFECSCCMPCESYFLFCFLVTMMANWAWAEWLHQLELQGSEALDTVLDHVQRYANSAQCEY